VTPVDAARTTPPPARRTVVEAKGVDHFYEGPRGWVHALDAFDLCIPENEFLCILGPSGSGKSTFLKIVAGLVKPVRGEVLLDGKAITGPGLDRGIVFQEPALFPWLTVIRNVEFGLKMAGHEPRRARQRAEAVLRIVGLSETAERYPYQLSGGQRHRVAVARAWALPDANLLLMDEPFSAIDAINRMTLQDHLIATWLTERRTLLYVTHDIDEAVYLADRVILLKPSPGRIAREFVIDMPRPRDRNGAAAMRYKMLITQEMDRQASDRAPSGEAMPAEVREQST
jgi:NitT/TauT family transport system ATP-binding protein